VVVLIYHRVAAPGVASRLEMELTAEVFDRQMGVLAATGRASTIDDALDALVRDEPRPRSSDPVVVTFDDGTADFVDVAVPILVRHGIPALMYVATDFVERAGVPFDHDGRPASWAGLRDACSTGLVQIGSHTHTHLLLDRADPSEAEVDLDRSIELIHERLGTVAQHFAYPKAVLGSVETERLVKQRFGSASLAGTRPNRYGATDAHRLARSPIQRSDGMGWFTRKLAGGLGLEDAVRERLNRRRYAGRTT
jgi:peptidoglycan/xylan/chitin deacetylase (PgdA/CDA1 family)